MFSDETDFFVGGKHSRFVRRSVGEKETHATSTNRQNIPPKKCFGDVLATKDLHHFFLSRE